MDITCRDGSQDINMTRPKIDTYSLVTGERRESLSIRFANIIQKRQPQVNRRKHSLRENFRTRTVTWIRNSNFCGRPLDGTRVKELPVTDTYL